MHTTQTGPFHHEERQLVGLRAEWYAGAGPPPPSDPERVREHRRRLQERLLAFVEVEEDAGRC